MKKEMTQEELEACIAELVAAGLICGECKNDWDDCECENESSVNSYAVTKPDGVEVGFESFVDAMDFHQTLGPDAEPFEEVDEDGETVAFYGAAQ